MSALTFILLIIAAPFLYVVGVLVAALFVCLVVGGFIMTMEWLENRSKKK